MGSRAGIHPAVEGPGGKYRKRGKSVRIVFRNKGERKAHRLNVGVVSDREARALAALVETWVQEERDVFAAFVEHREEAVRRPGLPTLGEASKEFVVWLQNRPVSPLGAK